MPKFRRDGELDPRRATPPARRGIHESSRTLHGDRPRELEDANERFDRVPGIQLTAEEKAELVAFLQAR